MASRRAAWLWGAAGLGLAVLAAKSHARYWPHEADGVLGEAAALAVSLVAGWLLLRARSRPWLAAVAAVISYLALSAADPRLSRDGVRLGGPAGYLYAPRGCEFAVRFPARPGMGLSEARGAAGLDAVAHRAELAQVGHATFYRAECLVFADTLDEAGRRRVSAWAADHLRDWVRASAGAVADVAIEERPDGLALAARHIGRDEANRPLPSRIAGRVAIGERSMMVVLATRLGGAEPDGAFLDGLARRNQARPGEGARFPLRSRGNRGGSPCLNARIIGRRVTGTGSSICRSSTAAAAGR